MNNRGDDRVSTMVLVLVLLMTGAARSQEVDLLGVFFDEQGTINTWQTSAPNEIVPIYLVLVAPSRAEAITSWECMFEARAAAPVAVFGWQLAGGGVNHAPAPGFHVSVPDPLPSAATVLLASASVRVPTAGTEIGFYLHAFDPPSLSDPSGNGYPVQTPNYGCGDIGLQALGWTSGCESRPVAMVNDDGETAVAELRGIPDEVEFGLVALGETVVRPIQLWSPGHVAISGILRVSGDDFYLAHSSRPWTQGSCWFRLEPGQELTINVMLQLSSGGERNGELSIETCGITSAVSLRGSGGTFECGVVPTALDFGAVPAGATKTMQVTVTNRGTEPLPLTTGGVGTDYSVAAPVNPVPRSSYTQVAITFAPTAVGTRTGVISLSPGTCDDVLCTGEGRGPECHLNDTVVDFGDVPVGVDVDRSFEIRNSGGGALEGEVILGSDCAAFAVVSGGGPFSLHFNESRTVVFRCRADQAGPSLCQADITGICDPIILRCNGIPATCSVTTQSLDFGEVPPGTAPQQSFDIRNLGGGTLDGEVVLPETCAAFALVSGGGPFALGYNQTRTVVVRCAPEELGPLACGVELGTQCAPVALAGIAVSANTSCRPSPEIIDFGDQHWSGPFRRRLIIFNEGNVTLSGDLEVAGAGFTIENPGPFTIDPGQQISRYVRFRPAEFGDYSGVVTTGLDDCSDVPLVGHCVPASSGAIAAWGRGAGEPPAPNADFVAVAAGAMHSLGLKLDGSIVAWGDNQSGQCDVPTPNTGFVAVAAGSWEGSGDGGLKCEGPFPAIGHSLALKADGSIIAWGANWAGQCDVPEPNTAFTAIATAAPGFVCGGDNALSTGHSLGLKDDGSIVVWGSELLTVPAPNADFVAVATGQNHSLGLKVDGSVVAWGANWAGQCDVPEPNADFTAIAAGDGHSLGLKADGSVVAWGDNWLGQCDAPQPNAGFTAIAAGYWHSLGLKADGSVVAWGDNGLGQCDVPQPNAGFTAIAAGGCSSLAVAGGAPVAALVTSFATSTRDGGVTLAWQLSEAIDPARLRLTASADGLSWQVPVAATGAGSFTAHDTSPRLSGLGSVRYVLELRATDGHWGPLREELVTLAGPPRATALAQPTPNPFNPRTEIRYSLHQAAQVTLAVYDLQGRCVRTLVAAALPAGEGSVEWDGCNERGGAVAAGVYVVRLETDDGTVRARKVTLAK